MLIHHNIYYVGNGLHKNTIYYEKLYANAFDASRDDYIWARVGT